MRVVDRGTKVVILGDAKDTSTVTDLLNVLLAAVREGHTPTVEDVSYALSEVQHNGPSALSALYDAKKSPLRRDLSVKPRTHGQRGYLDKIRAHEIVLVSGPAGTGKTYLAMAAAVSSLIDKNVERIVLTRPAVEAGESLGFLPGDLQEKVNPYLRPLYDALYSMVGVQQARKFFDRDQVEVAPLAFMRGRTFDHAFVILDEAQNTTSLQMKMFLTRLGEGSRAIITGDTTQTDLPGNEPSGLIEAQRILRHTPGLAIVRLTSKDVVRHPLVQSVVDAYDADDQRKNQRASDLGLHADMTAPAVDSERSR